MSPTASKKTPLGETPEAMIRRRRDPQQLDDAAEPSGRSLEETTADGDGAVSGLELIGQELVPASEALVPVEVPNGETGAELALESPEKCESFQTPNEGIRKPKRKPPSASSTQQGVGSAERMEGAKGFQDSGKGMMCLPSGPPVSFQPESPLPLFTPEQLASAAAQMQEARAQSSLLFPKEGGGLAWSGGMGMEVPQRLGPFPGPQPGFDSGHQGFHDHLQRDHMWRMEMERMMGSLGVQLRASQHENQRLRLEVQCLRDRQESSQYGTPEDKTLGSLGAKRSQPEAEAKEDGTRVQQALEEAWRKEDGAGAQQGEEESEDSEEDGQESQQDEEWEDLEERGGNPGQTKSSRESQRKKSKKADPTIQVLLKLVEGMQEMHKRIDDRSNPPRDAEVVRHSPEIPKLQEWCSDTAPIDFNDWLLCLGPPMSDLSQSSAQWWEETLKAARDWYERHMALTPIERLTHKAVPTPGMSKAKWARVERRAASLLLAAAPESLKEEVISSKEVTTLAVLTRGMCMYQPGGLSERVADLGALESPPEATTINAAISSLRRWLRWKRRASEIGVNPPDATILAKGLAKLTKRILTTYPDLHFRLSLTRSTLMIDTIPTQESVGRYAEHVLAELEQLGHQVRRKEVSPEVQPKVKKLEEASKGGGKGKKGRLEDEGGTKKMPCKYFLTEHGCRKGKECSFGHVLDGERRCWSCGAKDHFASQCPRLPEDPKKARAAKVGTRESSRAGDCKGSTAASAGGSDGTPDSPEGEDTMKSLMDEANRMLKSLGKEEVMEKAGRVHTPEDRLAGLQRQLDELRGASLRPFRISKVGCSSGKGLLDSGATHPLRAKRPGENIQQLPRVNVTLADDREVSMALSPTGVIIGGESTEPIIPMGLLTKTLNCQVLWTEDGLRVWHPVRGSLEVKVENGCPMVNRNLALDLIEEIEEKAKVMVKSLNWHQDGESAWLKRLAEEHPIFAHIPERVRSALVEEPAADVVPLANRRIRKVWRKKGVMVHAFSGPKDGYTLSRASKEVGGDQRTLYEFDKMHEKPEKDLGPGGGVYPLLLRLALLGWVKAWIGGPPCRTRSKLRHIDIPGMSMPRPVRRWNGEEFGLEDLTSFERDQVFLDDVLMMRFLMLYVVSEEVRKVSEDEKPTTLLLEQPAPPEDFPQCVSIWKTSEWLTLMKLYNMYLQTFDQAEFASLSTKPTSLGGNLKVEVPFPGRKGGRRRLEGKTKEQLCLEFKGAADVALGKLKDMRECGLSVLAAPCMLTLCTWR